MFTVAILVRGNVGLPVPNFILLLYDTFYLLLLLIVFIAFLSIFHFAFDGLLIARSVCWSRNNVYFKCLEICLWLSYGNSLKMVCCQIILAYPITSTTRLGNIYMDVYMSRRMSSERRMWIQFKFLYPLFYYVLLFLLFLELLYLKTALWAGSDQ